MFGVTSHFIDSKVDAGRIIERVDLPEYQDDTIVDVSVRLYQAQLAMFKTTMDMAINNDIESLNKSPSERKRPYSCFSEFKMNLPSRYERDSPTPLGRSSLLPPKSIGIDDLFPSVDLKIGDVKELNQIYFSFIESVFKR